MAKRHFLMLADQYDPKKHTLAGWFMSEKLDGQRSLWDGGITRGQKKRDVPWANNERDERYKQEQIATGLWSRYGNVIHAPDWFLDELPKIPLDGELWIDYGEGARQKLMSIIKDLNPSPDWEYVKYCVFDMPSPRSVFEPGRINVPNFVKTIPEIDFDNLVSELDFVPSVGMPFQASVRLLRRCIYEKYNIRLLPQYQLPFSTDAANAEVDRFMSQIMERGGEGIMVRHPISSWVPERSKQLLKIKPYHDDEATVTGYITGRKTEKGSKLLGKMGALVLEYNGKRFELSGFTDREREFQNEEARTWAINYPGEEVPEWIYAPTFPRGTQVTFRYRDLTRDGLPNEARYLRVRDD